MSGEVRVRLAGPEDHEAWQRFIHDAATGTLFHDLDFLDYHPAGRFDLRHLLLHSGVRLVGALPAAAFRGADSRKVLRSPYGASTGGLVWESGTSSQALTAWVEALCGWATSEGFSGFEMRLAPSIYAPEVGEALPFALAANGFNLRQRWLCHAIDLPADPAEVLGRCSRGKARDVRSGLRRGAVPREATVEDLPVFLSLLADTYRRHGTAPTHTAEELRDLFDRLPGRVRLFLCERESQPLAGVLTFTLTSRVAYTFYICQSGEAPAELNANAVLIAHIAETLAGEGFRYLDLGPSTFDDYSFNSGVAFFKEGMGGRGWCRDLWSRDLG